MNSDRTTVQQVCLVVPAGAGPYLFKAKMAPGAYRVSLFIKSNLTGTTTQIQLAPYVDEAQTQAAPSAYLAPNDGSTLVNAMSLAAGAAGKVARLVPCPGGTPTPVDDPIVQLANGLLITVTKGTAVSAEMLEIYLAVSQLIDAIAPNVTIT